MNKPIRMLYVVDTYQDTVYFDVDVYQFFHKLNWTCALCWFVKEKEWKIVDIHMLIPEVTKPQLNE